MNKSTLAQQLADRLSITQRASIRIIDTFQAVLADELQQEGRIMLQGFGTFYPWVQTERAGRNPRNGTPCTIRKRTSVKFKPGKDLLEVLNPGKSTE